MDLKRANGLGLWSPGDSVGLRPERLLGLYAGKQGGVADWPFYGPNDPLGVYAAPRPDGVTIRWMNAAFSAQLAEYSTTAGPIWAMHTPNGATINERGGAGTDSIPLTNSVASAYIHITWPTARIARSWRGHNLGGDWGAGRVPGATRLDAWDGLNWVTVDNGPAILNLTGDTGYRSINTPVPATQHRLFLADNIGNSAQSLCFLDIRF